MSQSLIEKRHECVLLEGTPRLIFKALNDIFHFTADGCCTREDALCDKFWDNSLIVRWSGERVFCNPPANKAADFAYKCIYETEHRDAPADLCVLIAAADMDVMGMIDMHATKKVMPPMGQMYVLNKYGEPSHGVIAVFEK